MYGYAYAMRCSAEMRDQSEARAHGTCRVGEDEHGTVTDGFDDGPTRAARLMDMMEEDGIVGPSKGAKPRDIMITVDELEEKIKQLTCTDAAAKQGT